MAPTAATNPHSIIDSLHARRRVLDLLRQTPPHLVLTNAGRPDPKQQNQHAMPPRWKQTACVAFLVLVVYFVISGEQVNFGNPPIDALHGGDKLHPPHGRPPSPRPSGGKEVNGSPMGLEDDDNDVEMGTSAGGKASEEEDPGNANGTWSESVISMETAAPKSTETPAEIPYNYGGTAANSAAAAQSTTQGWTVDSSKTQKELFDGEYEKLGA